MASFFRGGSIRDNLAHLLAMSYGMSGAVEVADDLLAQTGISDEIARLRAENERLRDLLRACLRGMRRYDWDVTEDGVSMPYGERTLREQVAQEVDDA